MWINRKIGKRSLYAIVILYLLVVVKLVLFKNPSALANTLSFYNFFDVYQNVVPAKMIPFKTINNQLQQKVSWFVVQNLFGNIILLLPLGVLSYK